MENFDWIEQYLAGKLEGKEKEAFEEKMSQDSELRSEVNFQKQLIENVKKARAAELKQLLSKVPVATPSIFEFSAFKMAASIIGGGALLAAIYFYYQPNAASIGSKASTSLEDTIPGKSLLDSGAEHELEAPPTRQEEQNTKSEEREEPSQKSKVNTPEPSKPAAVDKPKIDVINPSDELDTQESETVPAVSKPSIGLASIDVEVESRDKKHSFHYQFVEGKLVLFGSFDKGLYEVIEINGEGRSLFLFYKSAYHLLDESKTEITPLVPLQNQSIIKKLNQYRAQ